MFRQAGGLGGHGPQGARSAPPTPHPAVGWGPGLWLPGTAVSSACAAPGGQKGREVGREPGPEDLAE